MKNPISKTCTLRDQKGVALLTVLVSILIMSLLTIEFQYSVAIERKLAYSDLNQLQAHYLAKSGANFALLRIALFSRANKDASLKAYKQYLPAIWNLSLPPFPPAKSTIKKLSKSEQDAAEKAVEETKISLGQFSQTITSESSKINLNYLIVPQNATNFSSTGLNLASTAPTQFLFEYVARLLYNTIEDIFRKSENPTEEFGNYRAQEIVFDIMDWVNADVTFGSSNKDSFYEQQKPPYKAKRGRFFTLDELRLVRSVESNLFKKLKPHVTVYSDAGKINLNEASNEVLKAIYPDFTEDDLKKIQDKKTQSGGWASEAMFVNFVTQDLRRNGFSTLYPTPQEYPFTVNSLSFMIEATGSVPKNKYSIEKKIKVAVALTSATGAMKKSTATTRDECEKTGEYFWKGDVGGCFARPSNQDECENGAIPGRWEPKIPACLVLVTNAGEVPIKPPTITAPKEPNALKILYWMET